MRRAESPYPLAHCQEKPTIFPCLTRKSRAPGDQKGLNAEAAACAVALSAFKRDLSCYINAQVSVLFCSCTLFWKAFGIVLLGFTLWNGFKLIQWAMKVGVHPTRMYDLTRTSH